MVHIDLTPAAEVGFMLFFVAVPFVALLFLFRSLGNHGKRKMEANGSVPAVGSGNNRPRVLVFHEGERVRQMLRHRAIASGPDMPTLQRKG